MKMKNVSFVEKHVEKVVLGVGVLFLLAVIWFYAAFAQKIEVKVGNQTTVATPGQIERLVQQETDDLGRRLQNATPPEQLVNMQVPPYADELKTKITAPVTTIARLPGPLGATGLDRTILGVGGQGMDAAVKYNIPKLPALEKPVARADFAVLAEIDQPRLRAAWLRILNQEAPGDFRYVSVASAFDMGEWQKSLRQGGQPRIPEEWWRGQLLVTEVTLERQTLDPVTGKWGETKVVPRIPTQSGHAANQSTLAPENVNSLLTRIRARQPMILRPRLEPITFDRPWFPPNIDPDALSPRQREQAREVLRVMRGIEEQIERQIIGGNEIADDEEVFTAPGTSAGPAPMMMPPGGFSEEFGMGTMPPGMSGEGGTTTDFNITVNPTDSFETQLDELQKRLNLVLEGKDLTAVDAAAATAAATAAAAPTGPTGPRDIRRLATSGARPSAGATPGSAAAPREIGKLQIVVHDVTVQPGSTYRYRLKVGVYNPLFRKAGVAAEQRKELFDKLALVTNATDWTEAISVDPEKRFYLVSASPEQRESRWEVWRIHRGRWINQDFRVRPGDPIGAVIDIRLPGEMMSVQLDMSVAAALVDVQALDYTLGATQRALVLNTGDGALFERIVSRDRDDKARERLLRSLPRPEVQPQPGAQPGQPGGPPPQPGFGRRPFPGGPGAPGMGEEEYVGEEFGPGTGRGGRQPRRP